LTNEACAARSTSLSPVEERRISAVDGVARWQPSDLIIESRLLAIAPFKNPWLALFAIDFIE
jgi:hypothetical protein